MPVWVVHNMVLYYYLLALPQLLPLTLYQKWGGGGGGGGKAERLAIERVGHQRRHAREGRRLAGDRKRQRARRQAENSEERGWPAESEAEGQKGGRERETRLATARERCEARRETEVSQERRGKGARPDANRERQNRTEPEANCIHSLHPPNNIATVFRPLNVSKGP